MAEPNLYCQLHLCVHLHFLLLLNKRRSVFCFYEFHVVCFCRRTAPCKTSWYHLDGGFHATRSTDTLQWSLRLFVTQLRFCTQVSPQDAPHHHHTHSECKLLERHLDFLAACFCGTMLNRSSLLDRQRLCSDLALSGQNNYRWERTQAALRMH